jgi:hypothetical protein
MAWYDTLFDRLLTHSPDATFVSAIDDLKQGLDGIHSTIGTIDTPLGDGWLSASDDRIEQLHLLARKLAGSLGATDRKSEIDWILYSCCSGLDGADTGEALLRLIAIREQLHRLGVACETLSPLVRDQFLKTHTNLKVPARAVMPSTVALDVVAVTDIETDLASAVGHLERTLSKLRPAIDAVASLRESPHRPCATPGGDTAVRDTAGEERWTKTAGRGAVMNELERRRRFANGG